MFKTLGMHLAEQQKALAHHLYVQIYFGELHDLHGEGCAFKESVENVCDCVLLEVYELVKSWKRM